MTAPEVLTTPEVPPAETVPGHATDIGAAAHRPPAASHRYARDQLAHWVLRVASGLIDAAVVGWPAGVPYEIMSRGHTRTVVIIHSLYVTLALAVLVTVWEGRTGRSPGKALLRLRLVDGGGGQPLGVRRAIGRKAAHLLDGLSCCLGCLWPLWDEQRQTFADKVAGAVVLAEKT